MQSPELLVANSILKRGMRYHIPAPLFLRLLGKKNTGITITQLCAGTELRIAAILAEKELTEEKIKATAPDRLMLEHYQDILKITALASLNRFAISRVALWLRVRLLKRLSVWQLMELFTGIRRYSGTSPFTIITRLAVETRMTRPNLGQEAIGS
jgi:hypothetical protein